MRRTLIGLGFALASGLAAEEAPQPVRLIEVKKIWDQAPHNAFTDLIRFEDRWFCAFREGTGHAAGAGTIRVLSSEDGAAWSSIAQLAEKDVDLRDPKLSRTPDGRLMMVGGAAVPASRDPVRDHYSFVCFSRDGKEWSKPQRVLESWQWLWRVTWHGDTAYGVVYQWDPKAPSNARSYRAALYRSKDGLKYDKVTDFDLPNCTEATLVFEGDTMYCLQRRDGQPGSAMLGTSQAPYRDWTWKDLGTSFGGPNFLRLPDGMWMAAGRMRHDNKVQTVLCRLDPKQGTLKPVQALPSGGDTSYPGLLWHREQLWVSYYSSHEGKTSIYLARLR
jgi:hypothetical protein